MTIPQFLARLRNLGVKISVEGDRLHCNAPKGVLTPELRDELAKRKTEIIAFLQVAKTWSGPASSIVPIQALGSRRPFFAVPGHNGDVFCYVHLARRLGTDQPFYAFQPPGLDGRHPPLQRVDELAGRYLAELRSVQPEGPYLLGGYCAGGYIAFELAQQLRASGEEVALLALFETTSFWVAPAYLRMRELVRYRIQSFAEWSFGHLKSLGRLKPRQQIDRVLAKVRRVRQAMDSRTADRKDTYAAGADQVRRATAAAIRQYDMRPYPGRISFFRASHLTARLSYNRLVDWRSFAAGGLDICEGPPGCHPDAMLREPHVAFFAENLRTILQAVGGKTAAV